MINCRWKNLKKFMVEEKQEKHSISHALQKSQISFRKGCENFAHPTKISQRTPNFAKIFAKSCAKLEMMCKPCANSNSLCENQQSLKSFFKPIQALFSFRTPNLPIAKASITLRRPNFHSFFSIGRPAPTHLKRRSTPNLWNTDLSPSLYF